jgi:S-adenosyl methyltransferase
MAWEVAGGTPLRYGDLPLLDTRAAHPARVYDFWLGGKDNFEVDRIAGEAGIAAFPGTVASVRANRAFLARAVHYLAATAGIRQFLDIGPGLPALDSTHEVAQAVAPECRVVYVDNDPVIVRHAQALMVGAIPGTTGYVDADARDPWRILAEAAAVLDFTEPVAVLLFGILHFIQDDEGPRQIVDVLMDAVPPGSYLAVSHLAGDLLPDSVAALGSALRDHLSVEVQARDKDAVTGLFHGLDLVEPGVVQVSRWRPRSRMESAAPAILWGGVGRKPHSAHVIPPARNPAS